MNRDCDLQTAAAERAPEFVTAQRLVLAWQVYFNLKRLNNLILMRIIPSIFVQTELFPYAR